MRMLVYICAKFNKYVVSAYLEKFDKIILKVSDDGE
jgi:hypothetical protein